jgi:hypothetical protein
MRLILALCDRPGDGAHVLAELVVRDGLPFVSFKFGLAGLTKDTSKPKRRLSIQSSTETLFPVDSEHVQSNTSATVHCKQCGHDFLLSFLELDLERARRGNRPRPVILRRAN